jgi:hypothetical protein
MCDTPPYHRQQARERLAADLNALGIPRLDREDVLCHKRPEIPLTELTHGRIERLLALIDRSTRFASTRDNLRQLGIPDRQTSNGPDALAASNLSALRSSLKVTALRSVTSTELPYGGYLVQVPPGMPLPKDCSAHARSAVRSCSAPGQDRERLLTAREPFSV